MDRVLRRVFWPLYGLAVALAVAAEPLHVRWLRPAALVAIGMVAAIGVYYAVAIVVLLVRMRRRSSCCSGAPTPGTPGEGGSGTRTGVGAVDGQRRPAPGSVAR